MELVTSESCQTLRAHDRVQVRLKTVAQRVSIRFLFARQLASPSGPDNLGHPRHAEEAYTVFFWVERRVLPPCLLNI
jgi:hypothetical protein